MLPFRPIATSNAVSSGAQATSLVKERILAEDQSKVSDREKEAKVQGFLNQIVATNATLHVAFPIHRSAPGLIPNLQTRPCSPIHSWNIHNLLLQGRRYDGGDSWMEGPTQPAPHPLQGR